MACFCGCEEFVKNPNGKIMGCVNCNHGRQNHDDAWRESERMKNNHKNEILILDKLFPNNFY